VFVPCRPFQLGQTFVVKTGAYPSEAPIKVRHSRGGSWPYPQTLDKAGKACQGQTLLSITKMCKLQM